MDIFNFKPIVGTINPNSQALNRIVEFENGNAQYQRVAINTKKTWDFYIGGTKETYSDFLTFFDAHAPGQTAFLWYEPFAATPTQYTVVFNSDDFKPENQYAYDEDNNGFGYVGFKWKCSLRRVVV